MDRQDDFEKKSVNTYSSTDTLHNAQNPTHHAFTKSLFQEHVQRQSTASVETFCHITCNYALFQIFFFLLILAELFALTFFFSFFTKSALLAFTIAGLFFTGFAYFILLFYFQDKKTEGLFALKNDFEERCKAVLPFENQAAESHFSLCWALSYLLAQFHEREYAYYNFAPSLPTLSLLTKKFSAWMHWKDVHHMKEILLFALIKQYIHLIQLQPTDLQVHASLATTLISLSKLYRAPCQSEPQGKYAWVSSAYHSEEMHQKFKKAALKAIEELHILTAYMPEDPWTHAQLASIYQDLKLPDKEIKEYEAILALTPKEPSTLFHLGFLYFSQGQNAKGLRIYEKLKELNSNKAQELLSYYGASFFE